MRKTKLKLKNESHESTLETALDFTGADLEANREGQLTARQYDRLLIRRNKKRRAALTVLGLLVFVIVFCGFVALTSGTNPVNLGDAFFPLVIFTPLFMLILVAAANRWRKLAQDLRMQAVHACQGRVNLDIEASATEADFTVAIQNQKWKVDKAAFLAFKNGDPYCVYYAPHSRTLLSAEWLRED